MLTELESSGIIDLRNYMKTNDLKFPAIIHVDQKIMSINNEKNHCQARMKDNVFASK